MIDLNAILARLDLTKTAKTRRASRSASRSSSVRKPQSRMNCALICTTKWHPDAGWCVCEVREATHWAKLPKGPCE